MAIKSSITFPQNLLLLSVLLYFLRNFHYIRLKFFILFDISSSLLRLRNIQTWWHQHDDYDKKLLWNFLQRNFILNYSWRIFVRILKRCTWFFFHFNKSFISGFKKLFLLCFTYLNKMRSQINCAINLCWMNKKVSNSKRDLKWNIYDAFP